MDEMLCLHTSEEPNIVLPFVFKRLLPAPVRHALSTFPSINLRQWAKEADHLMADHDDRHLSNVATVRSISPAHPLPPLLPDSPPMVAAASTNDRFRRRLTPDLPRPS